MPSMLMIELSKLESRPKQTCAQCGVVFLPHRVGDGFEELCVNCYRTRFETFPQHKRHPHHGHKHHVSHSHLGKTA